MEKAIKYRGSLMINGKFCCAWYYSNRRNLIKDLKNYANQITNKECTIRITVTDNKTGKYLCGATKWTNHKIYCNYNY